MKRMQKIFLTFTLTGAFTLPSMSTTDASPLHGSSEALETRVADLEVELTSLRLMYRTEDPEIQLRARDLYQTRQRLAQQRPNGSDATAKAVIKALNNKIDEAKSAGAKQQEKVLIQAWRDRRTEFYKNLKMLYEPR